MGERNGDTVDVLTLGEAMALFWPEGGETLVAAGRWASSFAGAESNLAIALARLGHSVRWVSRLGADPFGVRIRQVLESEGVQVSADVDPTRPTGVFFKERAPTVGRTVVYYRRGSAASALSPANVREEDVRAARIVHLTGITPALSPDAAEAVDRAFTVAHTHDVPVSFDPNVRLTLWPDALTCRRSLLPLIHQSEIVLIGHEDAEVLFPDVPESELPRQIQALGPNTVVLKLGDRGAAGVRGAESVRISALTVPLVDAVGAGDGFDAGFLSGVLRGLTLGESMTLGAHIGAAAVMVSGDWEGYPHN